MKIAIAIPTHDLVPALFMFDLANLVAFTAASLPPDAALLTSMVSGTYIHNARNELAETMVEQGVDYILWLDSDMRFPRDAFARLYHHKLPMVGINYAKRGMPSGFVAIKKVGVPGTPLETLEDSTGLEEVDAVGFGCVLMRRDAFQNLPDPVETPWFQNAYLGDRHWMGEDVHFCKLLRESGVRIFVDHDLSKACSHVGQMEYTLNMAEAEAVSA